MKSLLLFLIAVILAMVLLPLGFLYALVTFRVSKSKYLFNLAFALDKIGNATLGVLMNDTLLNKRGIDFGHYDQTISKILGRNKKLNRLTFLGKFVANILNAVDPNHVEKASKEK